MRNLICACGLGLVLACANVSMAGVATYAGPMRTGFVAVRPVAARTVTYKMHRPHFHHHHTVIR